MNCRSKSLLIAAILGLGLFTACKPSVPSQYIQPDEMEDLLYDYYVGQGMGNVKIDNDVDYQRRMIYEAVLKKHHVTQAEFDSSLVYYYTRADRFAKIYENVQKRLSDEALALGTSSSEVERFTSKSLSGDTTEIWEGRRHTMLLPKPPYHIYQFSQKADSAFRQGDSFLMTLNSTFLIQSGSRNATAYLAVIYENDSVVSQYTNISSSGSATLRIPNCNLKAKEIRGFFYMAQRQATDNQNDVCLLFLDQIQLVRFHQKQNEVSTPSVHVQEPDTIKSKSDSTQRPVRKLGERPQPEPDRKLKPITR